MGHDRFRFQATMAILFAMLGLAVTACVHTEGNHQGEPSQDEGWLKEMFSAEQGTLSNQVALIVNGTLQVVDASGVTMVDGRIYRVAWSPDGNALLVQASTGSGSGSTIYSDLVVVSGSSWSAREYLQTDIMYFGGADWSPDGQNIVFSGGPPDRERLGVYIVNKDGTNPELVVGCGHCCHPTWSPDSSRIAFWGPDGVEIVEYDNPDSRELVYPLDNDFFCPAMNVSWFPDSRRLLISEQLRILLLDLTDGSVDTLFELSSEGAAGEFWAVVLSDGAHVACRAQYRAEESGPWYNKMIFANLDDMVWRDITPNVIESTDASQLYFDWWQAP